MYFFSPKSTATEVDHQRCIIWFYPSTGTFYTKAIYSETFQMDHFWSDDTTITLVGSRVILSFHSRDETAMLMYKTMAKCPSLKFCIIIEFNSQWTFIAIFLYTNMAAVKSRENPGDIFWMFIYEAYIGLILPYIFHAQGVSSSVWWTKILAAINWRLMVIACAPLEQGKRSVFPRNYHQRLTILWCSGLLDQ